MNNIEKEYQFLKTNYQIREKYDAEGSRVKVIKYMLENKDKHWFGVEDLTLVFTGSGEKLSHRAGARISELGKYYPELVEVRKLGRLHIYRLRRENMADIKNYLKNPYGNLR